MTRRLLMKAAFLLVIGGAMLTPGTLRADDSCTTSPEACQECIDENEENCTGRWSCGVGCGWEEAVPPSGPTCGQGSCFGDPI